MIESEKQLYTEKQECPSCRIGRLSTRPKTFTYGCSDCPIVLEKHCPNYFRKDLCQGCQYYRICCKRLNSKLAYEPGLEAFDA